MAAIDKTTICNMALAHCGVSDRIGNVETENSEEAINCRLFYDHLLNVLLSMQRWPFAAERVTLASIGSAPTNWLYRYTYPNYALRINHIVNPVSHNPDRDSKIPYEIMKRPSGEDAGWSIVTNQDDAEADINVIVDNPALFHPTFTQCFVFGIASSICTPLRVDPQITKAVVDQYKFWLLEAGNNSLSEAQELPENLSEFQTVRN